MIIVFGGTTEGRRAVEVLEQAGSPYYYSTKTGEQDIQLHHGQHTDGAMDAEAMAAFCREHAIRLLVDAAHPFATVLHQTVSDVATRLKLPVIRYERQYPERSDRLTWIDDYTQVPTDIHSLLATTGVQSISRLRWLEAEGVRVRYRILPRASSIRLAHEQGASDEQLCYYHGADDTDDSTNGTNRQKHDDKEADADAILLKESGLSGGFQAKVEAALARHQRIIVLRRPPLPDYSDGHFCDGPYGLRRLVEHLLPDFYPLHSGLTTGTCATAAAVAAATDLLEGRQPPTVSVLLPDGEHIPVAVGYGDGYAYCVKTAGDDPDVTDGLEIQACVERADRPCIVGGEGVGRFTLPGFDYPPGESAINCSPRQMIVRNLPDRPALRVTISVPGGADIAKKTFNPRLGIEGGISIIGVSGIVMPFSEEAFLSSIRRCMQVARASGADRVVVNSGAKSERYVRQQYPELPAQAFVEYGNYIGQTLLMAAEAGFCRVTLGVMLGKAVKLAEGQLDTHSRRSTMNKGFVSQMLDEARCSMDLGTLTLARELWELIPVERLDDFCRVVLRHCLQHCQPLVPQVELTLLLIADDGTIHSL